MRNLPRFYPLIIVMLILVHPSGARALIGGETVAVPESVERGTVGLIIELKPTPKTVSYGICTATLIDEETAITAAHCLEEEYITQIWAFTSRKEFKLSLEDASRAVRVSRWIMPRNFVGTNSLRENHYDLAMIKLSSGIANTARPISMAKSSSERIQPGQAWVAGFGDTDDEKINESPIRTLRAAEMGKSDITSTEVNGFLEGKGGPKVGDSGGPVLVKGQKNEYELVGVISGGKKRDNRFLLKYVDLTTAAARAWVQLAQEDLKTGSHRTDGESEWGGIYREIRAENE